MPWKGQIPSTPIQLADDEETETLLSRDYVLNVEYQGQQVETEQPLVVVDDLTFTPLSESGGPLPDGTSATLEDAYGELYYSTVSKGLLSFPAVPLGEARLSLDHYEHLSEPEYQSMTRQKDAGDSSSLRACSRAEHRGKDGQKLPV